MRSLVTLVVAHAWSVRSIPDFAARVRAAVQDVQR